MEVEGRIAFTITERTAEYVTAKMPVAPGMLNPYGIVNAGAMVWFADVCASVLVNGDQDWAVGASGFPLGVSINADFMGNESDGVLVMTQPNLLNLRR